MKRRPLGNRNHRILAMHRAVLIAHLDAFGPLSFKRPRNRGRPRTRFRQAAETLQRLGCIEIAEDESSTLTPKGREMLAEMLGEWADITIALHETDSEWSPEGRKVVLHYRAFADKPPKSGHNLLNV